jgi:hypothetical protein
MAPDPLDYTVPEMAYDPKQLETKKGKDLLQGFRADDGEYAMAMVEVENWDM